MTGPTSLTLYVKWKDGWSSILTDEPPVAVGKYTGSLDADGYKLLEAPAVHINLQTLGLSILSRDQHTPPHKRGSRWSACAGLWGRQGSPPSARASPGGRLCTAAWSGLSGGGPSRRPCWTLSSPRTAGTTGRRQPLREAPGRAGQGTVESRQTEDPARLEEGSGSELAGARESRTTSGPGHAAGGPLEGGAPQQRDKGQGRRRTRMGRKGARRWRAGQTPTRPAPQARRARGPGLRVESSSGPRDRIALPHLSLREK